MQTTSYKDIAKETASRWSTDRVSRKAAALAFYAMFSLAPILIIAIMALGLVYGEQAARGDVVGQLEEYMGEDAAQAIQTMIAGAGDMGSGLIATIISIVVLLVAATGIFVELQDGLNQVWRAKPDPGRGLMGTLRDRAQGLLLVVGISLLLLLSLVASAVVSAMGNFAGDAVPMGQWVWHVVDLGLSLVVVSLLFAMIFKLLPEAEIAWRDVFLGAFVTGALFVIGKYLIGLYFGYAGVGSTYGAFGSLVVLLMWIYYTSQILYIGAIFTHVYATRRGSRQDAVEPAATAVTQQAQG
jgi:membrane protein